MQCQVGITANPARREKEQRREYPTLKKWQILGIYSTKERAQKVEDAAAKKFKCSSHPGGAEPDDPKAKWSVYKFNY